MKTLATLTGLLTLTAGMPPAGAATLVSSTFASEGLTETRDIDVTGPNVVDWGYYGIDNMFAPGEVDNRKAAPGIGAAMITPGAIATATFMWSNSLPKYTMTFSDGATTAADTVGIGAGFGGWAPGEDNAATFIFEDLGAGTHTVRIYVGHSSNDRIFDMDYAITATDGNLSGNSVSPAITDGDLHSTYEIVFSTNDPSADLTLQFNSTSGGTGSGWVGGYVVETAGAEAAGPRLTSTTVTGDPGSRELELTLKGKPDSPYLFRSSTTLEFSDGTLIENLTQGDPANDPGTIDGGGVVNTDSNGDAVVRVSTEGLPANFLRAEELIILVD